jgi:hypothetical protein
MYALEIFHSCGEQFGGKKCAANFHYRVQEKFLAIPIYKSFVEIWETLLIFLTFRISVRLLQCKYRSLSRVCIAN